MTAVDSIIFTACKVIEEAVHGLFPAGVDDGIIFEDCQGLDASEGCTSLGHSRLQQKFFAVYVPHEWELFFIYAILLGIGRTVCTSWPTSGLMRASRKTRQENGARLRFSPSH